MDHQSSSMDMTGGATGASSIARRMKENEWRTTSRTPLQLHRKNKDGAPALAAQPIEVSNRYHLLTRDPTDRQVSNRDAIGGASGASMTAPVLLNETRFEDVQLRDSVATSDSIPKGENMGNKWAAILQREPQDQDRRMENAQRPPIKR